MSTYLVDVNVLIALADRNHTHHTSASLWIRTVGAQGWATCPMVECAVVRILSAGSIPGNYPPDMAHDIVCRFRKLPGHRFIPDDVEIDEAHNQLSQVKGSNQVTDAYLLALCRKHGLKLATFDQRIEPALAPGEGIVEHM